MPAEVKKLVLVLSAEEKTVNVFLGGLGDMSRDVGSLTLFNGARMEFVSSDNKRRLTITVEKVEPSAEQGFNKITLVANGASCLSRSLQVNLFPEDRHNHRRL